MMVVMRQDATRRRFEASVPAIEARALQGASNPGGSAHRHRDHGEQGRSRGARVRELPGVLE